MNLRRQALLVSALLATAVAGWAQFGAGGGWSTDYPRADQNFSFRLAELTQTLISRDSRGDINHLVVSLAQPELSRCPWIMMAEVGSLICRSATSCSTCSMTCARFRRFRRSTSGSDRAAALQNGAPTARSLTCGRSSTSVIG
jgi:hypothetical protein